MEAIKDNTEKAQAVLVEKHDKPSLTTICTELALQIHSNLGRCNSTCLGLTCKKFYQIHTERYGYGNYLWEFDQYRVPLFVYVQQWMGPRYEFQQMNFWLRLDGMEQDGIIWEILNDGTRRGFYDGDTTRDKVIIVRPVNDSVPDHLDG